MSNTRSDKNEAEMTPNEQIIHEYCEQVYSQYRQFLGDEQSRMLANQLNNTYRDVLYGIGDFKMKLEYGFELTSNAQRQIAKQEAQNNIDTLRQAIYEYLDPYTKEAKILTENTIQKLTAFDFMNIFLYKNHSFVAKDLRIILNSEKNRKKVITNSLIFEFLFSKIVFDFYQVFHKRIEVRFQPIYDQFIEKIWPAFKSQADDAKQKQAVIYQLKINIEQFVIDKIKDTTTAIPTLIQKLQSTLISDELKKGKSRDEAVIIAKDKEEMLLAPVWDTLKGKIDTLLDDWLSNQPSIIQESLKVNDIKKSILDNVKSDIDIAVFSITAKKFIEFHDLLNMEISETGNVRSMLREYLLEAHKLKITVLAANDLQKFDVQDLRLCDAFDDFRLLISSLNLTESQRAMLANKECNEEIIKDFDLKDWQPSKKIISILKLREKQLPLLVEYYNQYTKEVQKIFEEKMTLHNTELQRLKNAPFNKAIADRLLIAIKHSSATHFNLFISRASLLTLETALRTIHESSGTSTDQAKILVNNLKARIVDISKSQIDRHITQGHSIFHRQKSSPPTTELDANTKKNETEIYQITMAGHK